jgi:hypothetical protein
MKHPRIVSSEDKKNGEILFRCICSCGCGFRYHCTCRLVHDCVRATLKFNRCRTSFTASSIAAAHQAAQFWTHAANVATYLLSAFESLNGVPDAARIVVAHRYWDDRRRALKLPFRDHRTLEGSHQLIYLPQSISATLRTFRYFSMVASSDSD